MWSKGRGDIMNEIELEKKMKQYDLSDTYTKLKLQTVEYPDKVKKIILLQEGNRIELTENMIGKLKILFKVVM